MFWGALRPLLNGNAESLERLDSIRDGFTTVMNQKMESMWAKKLGLVTYDAPLVNEMLRLMVHTKVDYTIFFRKLSSIPNKLTDLKDSFYLPISEETESKWISWLQRWREQVFIGPSGTISVLTFYAVLKRSRKKEIISA